MATHVKTDVLRCADGLSDQEPRLWQAVDGTQERRHQQEALNVLDLHRGSTNVVQDKRTVLRWIRS